MKIGVVVVALAYVLHMARASPLLSISTVPGTQKYVDTDGRQRIFHGLNVVYKSFPFLPITVESI